MEKKIRLACMADMEELIRLLNVLFSQDIEFVPDYQKQKQGLELIMADAKIGEILVLEIDRKVAGMVSLLYSISTARGGKVAILEDMIIDENFRNNGLGTELLLEAIRFAQTRGCLRLTLLTDYNNDVAIEFYKKAGFTRSEMIPMRLLF